MRSLRWCEVDVLFCRCCSIFKLFHEDAATKSGRSAIFIGPTSCCSCRDCSNFRKWAFDTFTAGWLYTHALLHDLLGEYNVDSNVHGLKLAAKFSVIQLAVIPRNFAPQKKNNINSNSNNKKKHEYILRKY